MEERLSPPRSKTRLLVVAGPLCGLALDLEDELTIGRSPENGTVIPDGSVSRRHCLIEAGGQGYRLRDLGSRHGTYHNGKRVETALLADGDRIAVGRSVFQVISGDEAAAGGVTIELSETAASGAVDRALGPHQGSYLDPRRALPLIDTSVRVATDLETLRQTAAAVATIGEPERLADRLLELVFAAVPASRGGILVLSARSERGGALDFDAVYTRGQASGAERRIELSRTVAEQVVREGLAIRSNAVAETQAFAGSDSLSRAAVRSVLCVPLLRFERVIGVLYLDSSDPRQAFDDGHLELVTAIAAVAGLPLDAARKGGGGDLAATAFDLPLAPPEQAWLPPGAETAAVVFRSGSPLHLGLALGIGAALATVPPDRYRRLALLMDVGVTGAEGERRAGPAGHGGSLPAAWLDRLALLPRDDVRVARAALVPAIARLAVSMGATLPPPRIEPRGDARAWLQDILLAAALVVSGANHVLVEPLPARAGAADDDAGGTADRGAEIEPGRLLASRINKRLSAALPRPAPLLAGFADFLSLDGKGPMGATERGALLISDSADVTARKIRTARTDARRAFDPEAELSPEVRNLFLLHEAVSGVSTGQTLERMAGKGYGALKEELVEAVEGYLAPIRTRRAELAQDRQLLVAIARESEAIEAQGVQLLDQLGDAATA